MNLMESQSMWSSCRRQMQQQWRTPKYTHAHTHNEIDIIEVFSVVSAMRAGGWHRGRIGWSVLCKVKSKAQYGFARKIYGQQFGVSGFDIKRSAGDETSKGVSVCADRFSNKRDTQKANINLVAATNLTTSNFYFFFFRPFLRALLISPFYNYKVPVFPLASPSFVSDLGLWLPAVEGMCGVAGRQAQR